MEYSNKLRITNFNFVLYSYFFLSIILWISNFVCYYFWFLASKQIGKIAKYDVINDPDSLNWSSSQYFYADNALNFGILSSIIILFLTIYMIVKKTVSRKKLIVGILGIIFFLIICFGGFLSWMND